MYGDGVQGGGEWGGGDGEGSGVHGEGCMGMWVVGKCHDPYVWTNFLFFSSLCPPYCHRLCYHFGLLFVDSYLMTCTIIL